MGGHKKAGAAVKYGTQSEAGPPTHREPYLEIQNATDLFHHHQSAAKAKTQIIQMLEGPNVIAGLGDQSKTKPKLSKSSALTRKKTE